MRRRIYSRNLFSLRALVTPVLPNIPFLSLQMVLAGVLFIRSLLWLRSQPPGTILSTQRARGARTRLSSVCPTLSPQTGPGLSLHDVGSVKEPPIPSQIWTFPRPSALLSYTAQQSSGFPVPYAVLEMREGVSKLPVSLHRCRAKNVNSCPPGIRVA